MLAFDKPFLPDAGTTKLGHIKMANYIASPIRRACIQSCSFAPINLLKVEIDKEVVAKVLEVR